MDRRQSLGAGRTVPNRGRAALSDGMAESFFVAVAVAVARRSRRANTSNS